MNPYHLTPYFEGHKKTKKCAFKILLRCPNPKWQRNTCVVCVIYGSQRRITRLVRLQAKNGLVCKGYPLV